MSTRAEDIPVPELERLRANGRHRQFDWDKAAKLIAERKPRVAAAGLQEDWFWTGGDIYADGEPRLGADVYKPYLASMWATPTLDLDGERIECWVESEPSLAASRIYWPESALAILRGEP